MLLLYMYVTNAAVGTVFKIKSIFNLVVWRKLGIEKLFKKLLH